MGWKTVHGFTLIELMVAIAILAIVSTAGLVIFTGAQRSARDSKRTSDLSEIQKALEQYYAINKSYPVDDSVDVSSITVGNFAGYFQAGRPPQDPQASLDYQYYYCPGPIRYIICAKLESCGTKCNRNTLPTDGCATIGDSASPAAFYCIGTP